MALSPAHKPIRVILKCLEKEFPNGILVPRNQIAAIAWHDAEESRELIEHFEGSILLTPLELITKGFKCMINRDVGRFFAGDEAYALAGLLRERPDVDSSDPLFQAFARLSLANDSHRPIERLICMLPPVLGQDWDIKETPWDDFWGVKLWDVEPRCQVSGIGDNDTIIIDGACGANVRWKSFAPVASLRGFGWRRLASLTILRLYPYVLFGSLPFVAISAWELLPLKNGQGGSGRGGISLSGINTLPILILVVTSILFLSSAAAFFFSPSLVRTGYSGKFYNNQAWLFGLEGHESPETIERKIWDDADGRRLKWSAHGSSLSRHEYRKRGTAERCVAVDPHDEDRIADARLHGLRVSDDTLRLSY